MVRRGRIDSDIESGVDLAYFIYPLEFNITYNFIGGNFSEYLLNYKCSCGDYGKEDAGSNFSLPILNI